VFKIKKSAVVQMDSVIGIFNILEANIGIETFKRLFPVTFTDNGSEFSNPKVIECGFDISTFRDLYVN